MVDKEKKCFIYCVSDKTRDDIYVVISNSMNSYIISTENSQDTSLAFGFNYLYSVINSTENIKTKVSKVKVISDYLVSVKYLLEESLRKVNKKASNYEILLFNLVESLGEDL